MSYPKLDRGKIKMRPLAERRNKRNIERDHVSPEAEPRRLPEASQRVTAEAARRIQEARRSHKPVMIAFGAHAVKNMLAPVFIQLMRDGWLTHLATNGAGIIHDWEFAFQGQSSEDVEYYVQRGEFGHWEETLKFINLALNIGAHRGLGYGESIGALIHEERLMIPSRGELEREVRERLTTDPGQAAAAADLLAIVKSFSLTPGSLSVPHPWKRFSIQATAYELKIPFTGHPMFGHDIIYNHPMNNGASLGRAAERDYLTFAESVSRMNGGVFISMGSAVMAPMVFEKSMSMAQNLAIQRGERLSDHFILVVDLAPSSWDWSNGEPPEDNPEYYLRYNKSFSRMGGTMKYVSADNRDFLLHLSRALKT